MPHYLFQAAYTSDALAMLIKKPENRVAVVTKAIEKLGGRVIGGWFSFGDYDIVHAANLLCRLTNPLKLIERLPSLVRPGGQLLLTTPCTWLEEFTPRGNWPQGSTREWLTSLLEPRFDLSKTCDMPFLIREHARKYQWSVALGMRWRRKVEVV